MDIRPIKTEEDYEWALAEIEVYFDDEPSLGTPDGDRFDVLATLIGAYEKIHYPIEAPSPIEAIKQRMEQKGLTRRDLEPMIGSRGRVSEVLEAKRSLSIKMIRELIKGLDLPAEVLLQEGSSVRVKKPRRVATFKKPKPIKIPGLERGLAFAMARNKDRKNKRRAASRVAQRKIRLGEK
jgi:HTH-type transcriptional regulator / antitoxin HigA